MAPGTSRATGFGSSRAVLVPGVGRKAPGEEPLPARTLRGLFLVCRLTGLAAGGGGLCKLLDYTKLFIGPTKDTVVPKATLWRRQSSLSDVFHPKRPAGLLPTCGDTTPFCACNASGSFLCCKTRGKLSRVALMCACASQALVTPPTGASGAVAATPLWGFVAESELLVS